MKTLIGLLVLSALMFISCETMEFREMIERDEIVQIVNNLFIKTDEQDWPAVKACFTESVLFDMSSLTGQEAQQLTPAEIVESWEEGLKGLEAVHHQVGNYMVGVFGEEADVFCYAIALHYFPVPDGGNINAFVGSYDFHLIKAGNNWRIDKFKFNSKFVDGNGEIYRYANETRE